MSLQALMAVLGHVTPDMTLRYATLASPALRSAYDQTIGKVRKTLPMAPAGQPTVPDKVDWIASEFLKTRVAHGYCSRHPAAGACPYANICETCDNYVPDPEHLPVLHDQLSDLRQLRADAQQRGWDGEVKRHGRVISALEHHCSRLEHAPAIPGPPRQDHNGRLIERTFGETRRRTKVIGRLPGGTSCLTLAWAVLDRASRGWRGLTMSADGPRLLQDLRRSLLDPPRQLRPRTVTATRDEGARQICR